MEEPFDEDAPVLVGQVFVEVDELVDGVHGSAGAGLERIAIEQMSDEDGSKKVAGAVEESRYLLVFQMEVLAVVVVVARHAVPSVDAAAGDEHRLAAYFPDGIQQSACLFPRHSLRLVRHVGKEYRLGVVGEGEVCNAHHLAHRLYLVGSDAVIEPAAVAHDGVYEDDGAVVSLFATVIGQQFRLFFAVHVARADGIVTKPQFLPYRQSAPDVRRGVKGVELAVVERVGDECCRQVEGRVSEVGQDRQHGTHAHLAVACHVVDEEYLLLAHTLNLAAKVRLSEDKTQGKLVFLSFVEREYLIFMRKVYRYKIEGCTSIY